MNKRIDTRKPILRITVSLPIILSMMIGFGSCKRSSIEQPSPMGPSTLAIMLRLVVSPNVLYSGTTQQKTTLTATLTNYTGIPIPNSIIHFDIEPIEFEIAPDVFEKVSFGYFENNQTEISIATDSNGVVNLNYFGPLARDVREYTDETNLTINIVASNNWDAKEFITEIAPVKVILQSSDLDLFAAAFPDVLYAGFGKRNVSTITATVKTEGGAPIKNRPILFEITDELGEKLNIGYFLGNTLVVSRKTIADGTARVDYFAPLAHEITDNVNIFIRVSVSGNDDQQYVTQLVPIQIIREVTEWTMYLSSMPNVLFAGETRETSQVQAVLTTASGISVANQSVYFEVIDEEGNKANIGYFEGNVPAIKKTTNKSGEVSATYYGPKAREIDDNTTVLIKATLVAEGSEIVSVTTPIYIIRDVIDLVLDLFADPNILWATSGRPHSKITAVYKKIDGTPIVGKEIYFSVIEGPGVFGNGKNKAVVKTDAMGTAVVTYYGPGKNNIVGTQVLVKIQAQAETATPDWLHTEIDILIRKGN